MMGRVFTTRAVVFAALGTVAACGAGGFDGAGWWETGTQRAEAGQGPVRLLWTQRLAPEPSESEMISEPHGGAYSPVERAVAALDPPRDRIFVGTTAGTLYALRANGGRVWGYDARGAIESSPALDPAADELFVGTEQGVMHALVASTGAVRWREVTAGPIRQKPLLVDDAVYVISDTDVVMAHARSDGEVLWTYRREAPEGYSISGHAGLALIEGMLMTGMTDGTVVALDAADGTVVWERDTSVDVDGPAGGRPQFVDVDTTPLLADGHVYIASFAGGIYALEPRSGTVEWHDQTRTGVVGIAESRGELILSSADQGVVAVTRDTREELWAHPIRRGAASAPIIAGRSILVSVSKGAFLALSLRTGEETARFEAGYGFTAPPSIHDGIGFVVANGGSLHAFSY
jgi:outer membrane protein assembly factor BamB